MILLTLPQSGSLALPKAERIQSAVSCQTAVNCSSDAAGPVDTCLAAQMLIISAFSRLDARVREALHPSLEAQVHGRRVVRAIKVVL